MSKQPEFQSFAEFITAVVHNDHGGHRDARLKFWAGTGLGESAGGDGGFLVPVQSASGLWEAVYDNAPLLQACSRQPVTVGNTLAIPAIAEGSREDGQRWGGVRTYWAAEGETVPASSPTFRQITLNLKKLMGLAYATDELLQDAPALAAVLQRMFAMEAAFQIEDDIIAGTGAGRPLGILAGPATLTVQESEDPATEALQAAGTITVRNVRDMWKRFWAPSRRRGIWLVNPEAEPELFKFGVGDDGGVVFDRAPDGSPRLCGRPVLAHESCLPIGNRGDLILVDPSQYLVAERDPQFISSIHVRFLESESVFRFIWRTDGQPAWASAVTPKHGSATVSPYVVLEERDGTA